MDPSFRPLYAFIKLAVQPLAALHATQVTAANGFAFNGVSTAQYPFESSCDRHQLAPEGQMAFVQTVWNPAHEPFEPRPVFEVAHVDAYSYVWIAKNSHARSMPPPPDRNGPVLCACGAPLHVRAAPRFVAESGGGSWFCPDVHSDNAPARAFAPDLFAGSGPCAARDDPGFLSQWDPAWVEPTDEGEWAFTEEFNNLVTITETTDLAIARALPLAAPELEVATALAGATPDYLRRRWSAYAVAVQRRRSTLMEAVVAQGRWRKLKSEDDEAWRELQSDGFLKTGCVGAWFKEPLARLDVLLDYFHRGLPVFYAWSDELGRRAPELAPSPELRDAMQPLYDHLLPVPLPPFAPGIPPSAPATPPPATPPAAGPSQPDTNTANQPEDDDSMPADESNTFGIPDDVWDRTAQNLDEAEAAARRALAFELPPPPYRPVPMEGRDFFLVPSTQLQRQATDDTDVVPCRRADSYLSRLVTSEAEFLASVGRPRRRATTNAAAVVLPDLLRRMDPPPPPALAENVYLIIYEGGLVTRALEYALRHGLVTTRTELVDFLIDNGIRFKSGIQVANPEAVLTAPWHEVPDGPWFDESAPLPTQFEQWTLHLGGILAKPHVARAAQAYGGVLSLAARAVADSRFPLQPTRPTLDHGSPFPATYRRITIYDDYLTTGEIKLILGYPHIDSHRSLLPTLGAFNDSFAGVVTRGIAAWFQSRMYELRTGYQGRTGRPAVGTRNGNDWRKALRNELLNWYEPQPSLDGGAL